MEFIHQPYLPGETIAAIATPPGEGGVAIIRISGTEALNVASKLFSGPLHSFASHTVHYGHIIKQSGERIDHGLVIPMLGKRSYTGEDTVEIHCHGGSLIARRVLEAAIKAGARAARPGEFTFKAFINGKIDLAQAEAVQELIGAKNERALDAAGEQLEGKLSKAVSCFQKELTHIAAILEAWVDFPEEGLEFATTEELCASLEIIRQKMQKIANTYHDGRMIHEGVALCLIGSPNVGKSSLMNALLDKDRAIVSSTPGTTRDILEDHMRLNGLNFKLMDTAGIRTTEEEIEQQGIQRSKAAMKQADLILLVLDASKKLDNEDKLLIDQMPPAKTIAIWNKIDLPHKALPGLPLPHVIQISAKQKIGVDTLLEMIDAVIWKEGPPSKEEIVITNVRHKEALAQAIEGCRLLSDALKTNISPEFLTIHMREILQSLGKILGTNINEDILSSIFSTFCIGK